MTTQNTSSWKWESGAEIQNRRAAFLDNLLSVATISGFVSLLLAYFSLPQGMSVLERVLEIAPFLAGWLFLLIIWCWRGLGYRIRALAAMLLVYLLGIFTFRRGGLPGSGRVWLLALPAAAFLLQGLRSGIMAGIATILTYVIFALAFSQQGVAPLVTEDPTALRTWISEGASFLIVVVSLTVTLWASSRAWIDALAEASTVNEQLRERTQDLEKANENLRQQTSQLRTTAEVARAGASILDLKKLQVEVVNRIQEGFSTLGVYYVGLFLLDESQQFAVLATATGEAGQLLLDVGYKVELSEKSTVGRCIILQQPRIALAARDQVTKSGPLPMPHTRSEIALPLRSRGRVLGALTVQSTQEEAFSESDVSVLQTMADQVAVSIDNVRLFSQTEAALEEVRTVQRRYISQAWRDFLATRPVPQIDYTLPGTTDARTDARPMSEAMNRVDLSEARRMAMTRAEAVVKDSLSPDAADIGRTSEPVSANTDEGSGASQAAVDSGHASVDSGHASMVVPLKLRDQVIGTIALQETRKPRSWTDEDIELAETIAEQVSLTIETLRLMEETQRRAAHEKLVGNIASRVWGSLNPDTVLRTTVRELGRALGAEMTAVEITGPVEEGSGLPDELPVHADIADNADIGRASADIGRASVRASREEK